MDIDKINKSSLLNDKYMVNVKQSLIDVSEIDNKEQFRINLLNYINDATSEHDERFFYDMMEFIRFENPSSRAIAYTTPDCLIYLNCPGTQVGEQIRKWEFIYDHECLHQLWDTFGVQDRIVAEGIPFNHELLNIASDCVINDYLRYIRKKDPFEDGIFPETLKEMYGIEYNRKVDTQYTLYVKLMEKEKEIMNDPNMKKFLDELNQQGQSKQNGPTDDEIDKMTGEEAAKSAQESADRAKKAANDAQKNAENAQKEANKAQKEADKAQKAADKAKGTENEQEAQEAADKAKQAADEAQKKADKAKENAENAQKSADEAQNAADQAQQNAKNDSPKDARKNAKDARDAANKAEQAAQQAGAQQGGGQQGGQQGGGQQGGGQQGAQQGGGQQGGQQGGDGQSGGQGSDKKQMSDGPGTSGTSDDHSEGASGTGWGEGARKDHDDVAPKADTDLAKIRERAKSIIDKYAKKISGDFGTFIEKCKASSALVATGLQQAVRKANQGWADQMTAACTAFTKKKVFQKKREMERTYSRVRRGSGFVRFGQPIKPGKRIKENSLIINAAFYIDRSGSMLGIIDNVFDAAYIMSEQIKKQFGKDKVVNEIAFKMFYFDTSIHEIPWGKRVSAGGDNCDFSEIIDYIKETTKDYMFNIIITDAQFSADVPKITKFIKELDGMMVLIVNSPSASFKEIQNQNKVQVSYIEADSQFTLT